MQETYPDEKAKANFDTNQFCVRIMSSDFQSTSGYVVWREGGREREGERERGGGGQGGRVRELREKGEEKGIFE